MRKTHWVAFALTLTLGLTLAGCGQPNVTQVVQQLQSMQSNLTSYKTTAFMTVHLPGSVERYYVETWFQAPDRYRIALGNENKEISQIILHNSRGIYIISPNTKKVIKFQGDWAEKQGQLYLYHALLSKIVAADSPVYSNRENLVTFTMSGDPLNPLVSSQKIVLESSTYAPKQVVLLDREKRPVITVDYTSYQKGVTFSPNAFSPEQTTTLQPVEMPVSASEQSFGVIEPTWVPGNDSIMDETEQNGSIFVRYDGSLPFTIVENRPGANSIDVGTGTMVTLYGIPAVLTKSGSLSQLYWMNSGVEFAMTSRMNTPDLIHVAASTIEGMGK